MSDATLKLRRLPRLSLKRSPDLPERELLAKAFVFPRTNGELLKSGQWLQLGNGRNRDTRSPISPQIFSFDYEASKGGATLKIEVKGTTGDSDDAIFMTKNEVDLHTHERGKTGIIIVSGIQLEKLNEECVAKGGNLYADIGWDIGTWELVAMAFKVVGS